jgi:hypothetical protein
MKVFISWSGDLSHRIALSLREWLPVVLPFVEPWVSSEDIPKGARWSAKVASELAETHAGIICLVPDNLAEPWLNFEAGALSKSVETARIHPFLIGVEPGALPGPLAQFQATRFSKDDIRKLIQSLNSEAAAAALPDTKVDKAFDVCWPNLESRLTPLSVNAPMGLAKTEPDTRKAERDLTEEELKILCKVANSKDGLRKEEAGALVGLHPQRIQHIMESLQELRLLDPSYNYVYGTSWHLSKDGRAFLVKQGLL